MNRFILKDVTTPFHTDKEQATTEVTIYKNYWWLCKDGDPKQAIFYHTGNPQCNSDKRIMEHTYKTGRQSDTIGAQMGWDVQIVQIPMAYFKR